MGWRDRKYEYARWSEEPEPNATFWPGQGRTWGAFSDIDKDECPQNGTLTREVFETDQPIRGLCTRWEWLRWCVTHPVLWAKRRASEKRRVAEAIAPPQHPNCRCVSVYHNVEDDEQEKACGNTSGA